MEDGGEFGGMAREVVAGDVTGNDNGNDNGNDRSTCEGEPLATLPKTMMMGIAPENAIPASISLIRNVVARFHTFFMTVCSFPSTHVDQVTATARP